MFPLWTRGRWCTYVTLAIWWWRWMRMARCLLSTAGGGPKKVRPFWIIWVERGRITWNLQITRLERKMIFQTSMIMFLVNLQGCTSNRSPSLHIQHHQWWLGVVTCVIFGSVCLFGCPYWRKQIWSSWQWMILFHIPIDRHIETKITSGRYWGSPFQLVGAGFCTTSNHMSSILHTASITWWVGGLLGPKSYPSKN